MQSRTAFILPLAAAAFLLGCNLLTLPSVLTPSGNIITEMRTVSGVTGVDMRAAGRVLITQGASEALTGLGKFEALGNKLGQRRYNMAPPIGRCHVSL